MIVQDRVFLGGEFTDSTYAARRRNILTIAVNCGEAGGTCFCTSMKTGPAVSNATPHDIALTEIIDSERHVFVLEAGTESGAGILADLPTRLATAEVRYSMRWA